MKKVLSMIVVLTLFTTGCIGTKSPEEELIKAAIKMQTLDNYTMNMTIYAVGEEEGKEIESKMEAQIQIDSKNKTTKTFIKTDMEEFKFEMTSYSIEENDKITQYNQNFFGEGWTKTISTEEDADVSIQVDQIKDILDNALEIKKVGSKYEVLIKTEELKKLSADEDDLINDDFDLKKEIKIYFELKDGYIYSMEINLEEQNNEPDEDNEELYKLNYLILFENINKTTVKIPKEVIDEAVFQEDVELDF